MAVDGYMWFKHYPKNYGGSFLLSESNVHVDPAVDTEPLFKTFFAAAAAKHKPEDRTPKSGGTLFEIEDFSFGIEQTLSIGSQSTGSGAGKVVFNPFSINRKIDRSSPLLFQMSCAGQPFAEVCLGLRKSSGGETAGRIYLVFRFKLVAIKTIKWEYDDESPKESVEFEYGGLQVFYSQQEPDGTMKPAIPGGWNRVQNVLDEDQTSSSLIE